jgi:hypothetical protein
VRKSQIYATVLTAAILIIIALAILGSGLGKPAVAVSETITVTAPAPDPGRASARPDPHSILRRYLQAYDPYDVPRNCLDIRTVENAKYVFEVINRCAATAQLLGRWRVDEVTGAVLRRR